MESDTKGVYSPVDWSISDEPPYATAIVTITCVPEELVTDGLPLCSAG